VDFVVIREIRKGDHSSVIRRNDKVCIRGVVFDNNCVLCSRVRYGSERGPVGIASPSVAIQHNVESNFLHRSASHCFATAVLGQKELAIVNLFLGVGSAFIVISIGFPKSEFFHLELVHEDAPLWGSKMGHLWYKSYMPAFASSLRGAPFNMAGPISSVSTVKQ
jgi:hypothetical protein